ncbi:MAG TPA: ATP-grasp domain-containing protein [Thermomicrobiales bacterium]|jgi:biotin carboxylase
MDLSATRPRVILLMGPATYRAGAFLAAAERLGLDVVQGIDVPAPLAGKWRVTLGLDFNEPEKAARQVADCAAAHTAAAIVAVDDGATLVAAMAAERAGLPHNDPKSALAARDKLVMRERLAAGGVPVPAFRPYPLPSDPAEIANEVEYPCVVKPTRLSGSRGVIRADTPEEFVAAFERTRRMLAGDGEDADSCLLVEEFIPGVEVALEGLLTGGALHVLALFDKPDRLDGPYFEETIYVTPSRLPAATQAAIGRRTTEAAAALGLREGPVHAELRVNERDVWPIELAGRSIGGLCSTILEFGAGMSLEELILRHAVGLPLPTTERAGEAVGVMMIPIPRGGVLKAVDGQDEACRVPGITGLEITAKSNYPIVPLPEGASYLGFIFARGASPEFVDAALREAHGRLRIRIDPLLSLRRMG